MYAARKFYVQNWDFTPKEESVSVKVTRGDQPLEVLDCERVSAIEENVMYWRKANQIHAWFVDNVQDGNDDCGAYPVTMDKLRELLSVCQKVLEASKFVDRMASKGLASDIRKLGPTVHRTPSRVIEDPTVAKRLLPTREGFFFGSTEYDEEYLRDVKATHDWAVKMLSDLTKTTVASVILYSSSW